jgi:hypothetical protein
MSRLFFTALAATLLLVLAPAAGADPDSRSGPKLRGTVAQTLPANGLIRVDTRRLAHILRVPGSQARIHVGQRVELRGSTLRERGNGSRVLARGVVVAGSAQKGSSSVANAGTRSSSGDAGRLEIRGTLTSLSPPTVMSGSVSATCTLPAGRTLAGFAVGDFVEMRCVLRLGVWMLRDLRPEDDDVVNPPDDDDDTTDDTTDDTDGDTTDDDTDDDDDNGGSGGGNSGPGGGDD